MCEAGLYRGKQPTGGRRRCGAKSLLIWLGIFGLALIAGYLNTRVTPTQLTGAAQIIDGDSLIIHGERIRLSGIDAPELQQTCTSAGALIRCGSLARNRLYDLTHDKTVVCVSQGRDKYHRWLATCSAGAVELNRWMVANGWAVAYGGYRSEETAARIARAGIWAYQFETPQTWREQYPWDDDTGRTADGAWLQQFFSGLAEAVQAIFRQLMAWLETLAQ